MTRRLSRRLALALLGLGLWPGLAAAQAYPAKPIRWLVGYPAGGPTDLVARLIGSRLAEILGQPVVVESKPGAGNNIATEAVLRAPPDGYTMLLVNPANAINATLFRKLSFDFLAEWEPVAAIALMPNVMVVHPSVPAKTVAEFIAWAKANPGTVNAASSGNGTSVHLAAELFNTMAGVKMTHVPYRGAAPALADLVAGQTQVIFNNMPSVVPFIKSGELRALAVTSATRNAALPDLPTVAETLPGFEITAWYGMAGPKGLPPAVVATLNRTVNAILAEPAIRARLAELGADPLPMTPEEFRKLVTLDTEKLGRVVKESGATVD